MKKLLLITLVIFIIFSCSQKENQIQMAKEHIEKIGKNAWFIPSEINYWEQRETYYKNIALLGFFYEKLNYNNSIPFLLILPKFLKNTTQ